MRIDVLDIPVEVYGSHVSLPGELSIDPDSPLLVILAHGRGSNWRSPRATEFADGLRRAGFSTLRFDQVTSDERRTPVERDLPLITARLLAAADWAHTAEPRLRERPVAFFGSSFGGAAAIAAAERFVVPVTGAVCRAGRPDLALRHINSPVRPTLLLVGGADVRVAELNWWASVKFADCRIVTVADADHFFSGQGAARAATDLTVAWLRERLLHSF